VAKTRHRLPRGTLNEEAIVLAALRLLEHSGAQALTIRGVARELGADPTALYRHFRNKSEMLGAVADRLLADVAGPPAGAPWREALEQVALQLDQVLQRHSGAIELLAESDYTPTTTSLLERTVAHLMGAGLPAPLAGDAVRAVVTLVFGHAVELVADEGDGFWPELLAIAQPPAAYPAIHADAGGWSADADSHLRRQLAIVLDGVAAQLGATPPAA
jgi:TetR/AcrR family transcriptional regulator, tetracycline repressor protein